MSPSAVDATPGVLIRLPAGDRRWPDTLPRAPGSSVLTISVGHPRLLPLDTTDLEARGYRIVGVAVAHRPIGATIDVLVPGSLLTAEPAWVQALQRRAERVFDLRMGPVQRVLAPELAVHRRGAHTVDPVPEPPVVEG